MTAPVQLTFLVERPTVKPLPYGACLACEQPTDPATLPHRLNHPVWPLRCPRCGATAAGWCLQPARDYSAV